MDNSSRIFEFPKELNATIEGYYHEYEHDKGKAVRVGLDGYTYDFNMMTQKKTSPYFALRKLQRNEVDSLETMQEKRT